MLFAHLLSFLSLSVLFSAAHALPTVPIPSLLSTRGTPVEISTFLFAHNSIRSAHNASDLTWSPDLAEKAELWADNCLFQRTEGLLSDAPYGELHAAATGPFPIPTAISQFTQDQAEYDPAQPTYTHWTQIVWKATTQVGCARSQCVNLLGPTTGVATYYVCLYDPAGNIIGQAPDNVQV